MVRGKRQIMGHVHVFKHLLRHAMKYWCRYLAALVETHRRIENHGHHYLRIIQRSKTGE